jgi:UDP-N-acetylglucosamine:LPS N-acetylglucosamine transferase
MLISLLSAALPYDPGDLAGNGVLARLFIMKWTWLRLIRRLEPAVRKYAPDAIVCTQMIPAAMVAFLKKRGKIAAPLIGVMTDFGLHDFWKQEGVARYCVPHESIATDVNRRDVVATGVPLMPDFACPTSQLEARRQLQLPADVPVALVLGGGLGLSVDAVATTLLAQQLPMHLLVLPGKNVSARMALSALAQRHPERLRVYDWTERMDLFMRAADLIVSKPGGVTVAEALACGRPLLATRSLGGQEGFNVNFLERNQVGGLVSDRDLPARVQQLLHDRAELTQMQRRAWLLGHRDGAAKVAAIALELAVATQARRAAR